MTETRSLTDRLVALIRENGPMSVAEYMRHCLADPIAGYYMNEQPFGRTGDFITAPEVSQMFGELVGIWCLQAWMDLGRPDRIHLVELGPGRGTLMGDLLRATQAQPAFATTIEVHLVETSPQLREEQRNLLAGAPCPVSWHDTLASVPEGPILLVANEFFDALPIRQYVRDRGQWRERMVGLAGEDDELSFGIGAGLLPDRELPGHLHNVAEGAILETQPPANAIAAEIAARVVAHGGAALFIDYGYTRTATGDTLQAVRRHEYAHVLEDCGAADLTAHVNFEALGNAALQAGAAVHGPMTQGEFLLGLGLLERAGALGSGREPALQERLRSDVERLAAPGQMGDLFKVMALSRRDVRLKPFDS